MSRHRVTVVLSQAQGKNPAKRALEESLTAALIMESGLDVSVLPYLYDLDAQHTGRLFLEGVSGDMIVLAWMFPRAAFWVLDRDGIKGQFGETLRRRRMPTRMTKKRASRSRRRGSSGRRARPAHLPPRPATSAATRRTWKKCGHRGRVPGSARGERASASESDDGATRRSPHGNARATSNGTATRGKGFDLCSDQLLAPRPGSRVGDGGLHGVASISPVYVYGVDCSTGFMWKPRQLQGLPRKPQPEQAIIFPDYKTPAIAGAAVGAVTGLKIDLTKLFGGEDAIQIAASERDRELVADGRDAVGLSVGIPKRQEGKSTGPKDELDNLMDQLDGLDL